MKKSLELNNLQLDDLLINSSQPIHLEKISNKDIAIIGMAGQLPQSADLTEFWEVLRQGLDCVGPYSEKRKADIQPFMEYLGIAQNNDESEAAYLAEIDKFDPLFFNISPKEASLMDPNQRLFLQIAWRAIEDAGYGGKKIMGTDTGVYLGFSNDGQIDYKFIVQTIAPELAALSTSGNIKSIIASRISYLLDLKGPSMVVDTACSSALTAVHLACTDLQKGRCEMAIAGGIKIILLPSRSGQAEIGIRSSTGRAHTFDNDSDGTGLGEGVIALLLKPLKKAIADRDNIHAVIRGSAVNQDGASVGITAPNSLAQAQVIESAWKDANIDPETITYIETHGTGTVLGDPIEINGMTKAFRKYTDKKQFCGVSSVKTNIGHLDSAAGIAGLLKAILALKHRELPTTVHYQSPNQKIDFAESPVYVIDQHQSWQVESPRRCGVSAFGLSGTNCHLVLEEAPARESDTITSGPYVLTLSAKTREVLERMVRQYVDYLSEAMDINCRDLCYTISTGRGHYNHRLAVIFNTRQELITQLQSWKDSEETSRLFYGEHRIIAENKEVKDKEELTESERRNLSTQVEFIIKGLQSDLQLTELEQLCQMYIRGADINWEELYLQVKPNKLSLPTYPFESRRCWIDYHNLDFQNNLANYSRGLDHPLFDLCLAESYDEDIYLTEFSVDTHWVLKEHLVNEYYVIPGTTYLEMGRTLGSKYYPDSVLEFSDVIFFAPLIADEGESKTIHTIVKKDKEYLEYVVVSRTESSADWVKHAEGKIKPGLESESINYDLVMLKEKCPDLQILDYANMVTGAIKTGGRWKNVQAVYLGDGELLVDIQLPAQYAADIKEYGLHPALLDIGVNLASQQIGDGLYLPFSYKRFVLYKNMPERFYSYIRKKDNADSRLETISFDITLMDEEGHGFAQIFDYTIKKVHQADLKAVQKGNPFFEIGWVTDKLPGIERDPAARVLIFTDEQGIGGKLAELLRQKGQQVITVNYGTGCTMISSEEFTVGNQQADYEQLFAEIGVEGLGQIIHLQTVIREYQTDSLAQLSENQKRGVDSLFNLTKAILKQSNLLELDIVLISKYVNSVMGDEKCINPGPAALFGLGKVIVREYSHLICRCIDIDDSTPIDSIVQELAVRSQTYQVAYRADRRYVEEFRQIKDTQMSLQKVKLHQEGVYLITGGTGGIGLEIGRYLARQAKVNLALLNRSILPEKEQWDEIIQSGQGKLAHKLQMIREMESLGSRVVLYSGDVSDYDQMTKIVGELRSNFGRINGLIHSAGNAGDGFIIRKEKTTFDQVLAPKISGTWVLDRLTREDDLDFFIMFSSISSLLGSPGQGDYTAANSYLDAYASYRCKLGQKALTINWPAWKEVGMAVDYGANQDGIIFKTITTNDAINAFDKIFSTHTHSNLSNVTIGELNYQEMSTLMGSFPIKLAQDLKIILNKKRIHKNNQAKKFTKEEGKRPVSEVVVGGGDGNYTQTEMLVARIWGTVLGLAEINVYTNFYDLGGDSILATHLAKELEQEFAGILDISDIFTYPSVHELAVHIDSKSGIQDQPKLQIVEEDDQMDDLLDRLASGEISVDDVELLFKDEDLE